MYRSYAFGVGLRGAAIPALSAAPKMSALLWDPALLLKKAMGGTHSVMALRQGVGFMSKLYAAYVWGGSALADFFAYFASGNSEVAHASRPVPCVYW